MAARSRHEGPVARARRRGRPRFAVAMVEDVTRERETQGARRSAQARDRIIVPGLKGRQTGERIRATRPGLKVLYMSRAADAAAVRRGEFERGTFIQKPFDGDEPARRVRELLDLALA